MEHLLAKIVVTREGGTDLVSPTNGDYVHFGEGVIMFLHEDMVLLKK
jgi:hypothetical protein